MDGADNCGWLDGFKQQHRGSDQGRNEDSHELPKYMAQWEQIEKAQRMEDPLVSEILLYLAFDGLKVCEDVAVGKHDALWFPGSA